MHWHSVGNGGLGAVAVDCENLRSAIVAYHELPINNGCLLPRLVCGIGSGREVHGQVVLGHSARPHFLNVEAERLNCLGHRIPVGFSQFGQLAFLEAIILQANLNVADYEVDIELAFELT